MFNMANLLTNSIDKNQNDYDRLVELGNQYYAPTTAGRLFKIPVETADEFSKLLRKFKRKDLKIVRRAGGGPRRDAHRMVCLVKDAKYFVYYLRHERLGYVEPIRVAPNLSNKELMDLCGLSND